MSALETKIRMATASV